MHDNNPVRWGGIAALIAALLIPFAALGRLFSDPYLALLVSVGNVGFVFLIFAFMGIGRVYTDEIGAPGVIVAIAGTVGAVLMVANGVVVAYVYPALDEASVTLLQGTLGLAVVNALGPLTLLIAVTLLVLYMGRTQSISRWAAWVMFVGILLGVIPGLVLPEAMTDLPALLAGLIFAAGLAWMGANLLTYSSGQADH